MTSLPSSFKRHRGLSPSGSLPQVPVFQPTDSPLPPVNGTVSTRTWELTTRDLDMPPPSPAESASGSLGNNEFGSDDDEEEVRLLSLDELRARCLSLMRAAKSRELYAPSPRNPPPTLSPAMYSVHSRNHGVRRLQLGRTSSIATRDELNRMHSEHAIEDDVVVRLTAALRNKNLAYVNSEQFADDIIDVCSRVSDILEKETRVLELKSPIFVFGDTHGNVEDLKFFADNVWPLGMPLTAGAFLFLGDYVDRGSGGLEVLAYLFAQKVLVPHKLFMLRGNHETRSVNGWEEYYGNASFLAQCKNRFGVEKGSIVWEECNRVFDRLPLAAIIDKTIFCVHGGIPRPPADPRVKDTRLDDIRRIPCPIEVRQPVQGVDDANRLAFSLLWSDPADSIQEPYLEKDTGFGSSVRGSGSVVFGIRAVEQFLKRFNLGYIMRAHEATANGVAVSKSAKVLTVFSTSKDHGCGGDAKCGCVLVDVRRIVAITRAPDYASQPSLASSPGSNGDIHTTNTLTSHAMVVNYRRSKSQVQTRDEDENDLDSESRREHAGPEELHSGDDDDQSGDDEAVEEVD